MNSPASLFSLPVFLIARAETRDAAAKRLRAAGWHDITIVEAVMGGHIWGVAQSHACAAARGRERGAYPFLILEDDAHPTKWLRQVEVPTADFFRLDLSIWSWDAETGAIMRTDWEPAASREWALVYGMLATAAVGIGNCHVADHYEAAAHMASGTGVPLDVRLMELVSRFGCQALRQPLIFQGPHAVNQNAGSTDWALPLHSRRPTGQKLLASVYGGLGNQMFQYANALELTRRCGLTLGMRMACQDCLAQKRDFSLGIFGIEETRGGWSEGSTEVVKDESNYTPGMEQRIRRRIEVSSAETVVVEGYFQNEAFFSGVSAELRGRFRLEAPPNMPAVDRPLVGVHVRRGDFVGNPRHDLCTYRYYTKAMSMLSRRMADPLYIFVSDDSAYCRSVFADRSNVLVYDGGGLKEDFALLANCQSLIIANSTFSWWAAWLSGAETVIRPSEFLNDRSWNIGPEGWIRISGNGEATDAEG
jgi:hypothetical protein